MRRVLLLCSIALITSSAVVAKEIEVGGNSSIPALTVADVPAGFSVETGGGRLFAITNRETGAIATLNFSTREIAAAMMAAIEDYLSAEGAHLVKNGPTVSLPLGKGMERVWHKQGKSSADSGDTRLITVPACDGKAAVTIMELWGEASDKKVLDSWISSVKFKRSCDTAKQ